MVLGKHYCLHGSVAIWNNGELVVVTNRPHLDCVVPMTPRTS